MDITLDKKSNTQASIKINLKEEDYQPQIEEKVKEYRKKANLKGFRPGKVPPAIIKKMYGKGIKVEEINQLISQSLPKYIKDQDLNLVGEPLPNYENAENIDWENQKDFEFTYDVGFVNEFEYDVSDKLKITKYKLQLGDKEIDETIENLREQFNDTENVDVVGEGDIVNGKVIGNDIENETSIDLKQLDEKQSKVFIGAKKGDDVVFDIRETHPEDSEVATLLAKTPEEVAEVKGEFTFNIESILHRKPGELNQEFFDKVFGKDAVKTEEEFREKVKETMQENYDRETDNLLMLDIRNTLVDNTEFEIPEEFLKRWLLEKNEGNITQEQIDKEFEDYVRDLRWNLIVNKISEDKEIKVEHDDVKEKAREMIEAQLGQSGLLGQLGDNLDPFVDNYLQGENGNNYMQVFNQARTEKIFDFIKENATLEEKKITVDDFKEEVDKRQ
ncbi:trigger factor [Catalinimonas alkaloidigena]|uniref:trigger factor n=1 Tax=Catalinimonas alkaloidigena TaxID=1075417 RepID=UPI002404AF86|nr:trigger factor [Catalinimonas alkaloidigena]MDF9797611.1 trigger factor [Catalinimonas alkaloidigena]